MSVSYNGKKIIPAPQMTLSKEYQRTGDGTIIGKLYNITLIGTIVADMGSPNSTGVFWDQSGYPPNETVSSDNRLTAIQKKQLALMQLFATEGKQLEVLAMGGTFPFKCNVRLSNIEFSEGVWYDRCEYKITLEADEISSTTEDVLPYYISDATENWSVDTDEGQNEGAGQEKTYKVTHTISATGKRHFDENGVLLKEAWEQAKDYVVSRLGLDATIPYGEDVLNIPSYYEGFNHIRTQSTDKAAGTFEATESWVLANGEALEEFTVDISKSLDAPYTKVSIQGTITGLETRQADLTLIKSKYDNAATKFAVASGLAITRAQTYSGMNLNVVPIMNSIGKNVMGGTITYSYEYDNRPAIITGAKSATISANDNLAGQQYASIFVLGRNLGPVLQDLSTTPEKKRSLSIELRFDPVSINFGSEHDIRDAFNNNPRVAGDSAEEIERIIAALNPANAGHSICFYNQPQENWNPLDGTYTYNIEWAYE